MPSISLKQAGSVTDQKPPEPAASKPEPKPEPKAVQEVSKAISDEQKFVDETGEVLQVVGGVEGKVELENPTGQQPKENNIEVSQTKKKMGFIEKLGTIGTVSQKEVLEFTRHLAVMLGAGVTIFESIKFLAAQNSNKSFQFKLEGILERLNNGQSLSAAMKKYPKVFPEIYVNIVSVGEQSGTLSDTMMGLADNLEENDRFKGKVKGAMIYPKIIMTVMFTFMIVLAVFVMPRILTIFDSLGAEIPFATQVIIAITNFINKYIALLILGGLIGGVAFYILMKNPKIKKIKDRFYLKIPIVGRIVRNYNTAQVSHHLGSLLASGITVLRCLEITQKVVGNSVFQSEIEYMTLKIKGGAALSQSFKEDSRFPGMFVKLIKVGERTGKLPHVIDYMARYYKGIVDTDVKNISTVIEPAIMVLLGLMVAGLVVTVIGPIYTLISDVGQS